MNGLSGMDVTMDIAWILQTGQHRIKPSFAKIYFQNGSMMIFNNICVVLLNYNQISDSLKVH